MTPAVHYAIRRLLEAVPILWGVVTLTFVLIYVIPGDPARLLLGARADQATVEAIQGELGLDQSLPVQYGRYLVKAVRGDLGRSYATNRPVVQSILERLPATALLGLTSLLLAVVLGIPLGVVAAIRQGRWPDRVATLFSLAGLSIPIYFLAILLAWIFGYLLDLFPLAGAPRRLADWEHLVLPAVALATRPLAVLVRLTRGAMVETLAAEYIRAARARGLPERKVIWRHALRNALNPVVTAGGQSLAALLTGAFFVEFVFQYPGVGLLAVQAVQAYDVPVVMGTVLFAAGVFVLANLAVDLVYRVLDPRVLLE